MDFEVNQRRLVVLYSERAEPTAAKPIKQHLIVKDLLRQVNILVGCEEPGCCQLAASGLPVQQSRLNLRGKV